MKLLKMVLFIILILLTVFLQISFESEDKGSRIVGVLIDGEQKQLEVGTTFGDAGINEDRNYRSDYVLKNSDKICTEAKNEELVSINDAGLNELIEIPGIGEKTAAKIIEYREKMGGFHSLEELMNIPGIKEKKYANIKAYISI